MCILLYQVMDAKEFLQRVDKINKMLSLLPDAACFAVCDVVSQQSNVKKDMDVPATKNLIKENPNPKLPSKCILEVLDIALHGNDLSEHGSGWPDAVCQT